MDKLISNISNEDLALVTNISCEHKLGSLRECLISFANNIEDVDQ